MVRTVFMKNSTTMMWENYQIGHCALLMSSTERVTDITGQIIQLLGIK